MTLGQAIGSLPPTSSQVASFLKNQSCEGIPRQPLLCPLAVYFRKQTGDYIMVSTCHASYLGTTAREYVGLPEYLSKFVREFDEGLYPELIVEK